VLSISGYHMALVAGGVIFFVRAGLALIPGLALRYPIKKWAAAVALSPRPSVSHSRARKLRRSARSS
jgi:predicted membrane metal-binding protein